MSDEVEVVMKQLAGKLTREHLVELSERMDEVTAKPFGWWKVRTANAAPLVEMNVNIENLSVEFDDVDSGSGLQVSFYTGAADGVPVVQIDGNVLCRVNVNDFPIWHADPTHHEHKQCSCVEKFEEQP
jgi:hypothetical protein